MYKQFYVQNFINILILYINFLYMLYILMFQY